MNDGRRRRSAKQGRRDAQRAAKRLRGDRDDNVLDQAVRVALAKHPAGVLSLASFVIGMATPDQFAYARREARQTLSLLDVVTGLAGRRSRETTVLLAVLAELLVDDDVLRDRCRQEVAARNDHLPKWLAEPWTIEAYRAVRQRHVLNSGDEWAIGVRVAGRSEFTIAAHVDHDRFSAVTSIAVHMTSLDEVLADHIDGDTIRGEASLADARASLAGGLVHAKYLPQDESWRQALPLLTWLIEHLPDGGAVDAPAGIDYDATEELVDAFVASPMGAPFRDFSYRDLLMTFFDTGSGDPLRWSAARIADALRSPSYDDRIPIEVAIDAPALLRAFVPFAHARCGIRQGFTDEAITTIDEMSLRYRRRLLDETTLYSDDDGEAQPPWLIHPGRAS